MASPLCLNNVNAVYIRILEEVIEVFPHNDFILQHDNCTALAQNRPRADIINVLPWPSRSPDN
jgi:hypothetical protein